MSFTRRDVLLPEHPVLVVALEGWIDPGFAAATALASLLEHTRARTYVAFDGDDLIDQRARRPRARIHGGVRGRIFFPAPRIRVGRDLLGSGVAFLVGPEPDYHWRAFSKEVTAIALELGTELVVGLGAFPAPVPHTRPIVLSSTASSAELASKVGFRPGVIDIPAGIGDIIGAACSEAGIPSVGIWARVPHYVGAMPFPPASLALVEGLASVTGLAIDNSELRTIAEAGRKRVDELIAQSDEHQEMVRQLEEQFEEESDALPIDEGELPSGDELAAELERYLRGEAQ